MGGYYRVWKEMRGNGKVWKDMQGYERILEGIREYERKWEGMIYYDVMLCNTTTGRRVQKGISKTFDGV